MSSRKRKSSSAVSVGVRPPEPSPEEQKVAQLLNQLVNKCVALTLDVATDKCKCVFYKHAKEIAKIVKELYELRKAGE